LFSKSFPKFFLISLVSFRSWSISSFCFQHKTITLFRFIDAHINNECKIINKGWYLFAEHRSKIVLWTYNVSTPSSFMENWKGYWAQVIARNYFDIGKSLYNIVTPYHFIPKTQPLSLASVTHTNKHFVPGP